MPGGQVSARTPRLRRETRAGARTAEAESGRERAAQGRAREPTSPQNAEPARRLGFEGGAHDGDSAADVGGADDTAARRRPPTRLAAANEEKKRQQAQRKKRMDEARGSWNTGDATGMDASENSASGRPATRAMTAAAGASASGGAGARSDRNSGRHTPGSDRRHTPGSDARNDDDREEDGGAARRGASRQGTPDPAQRRVGNTNGQGAMSGARRARGIKDNLIDKQAEVDAAQDKPPWDGPSANAVAGKCAGCGVMTRASGLKRADVTTPGRGISPLVRGLGRGGRLSDSAHSLACPPADVGVMR